MVVCRLAIKAVCGANYAHMIGSLIVLVALSSCTISAKNHHFALKENSAASFDDFRGVWCFIAAENESLQVCSHTYRSRSQFIGFGLPVFPQLDRSSRLAYDNIRPRTIKLTNENKLLPLILSELKGVQLCPSSYSSQCYSAKTLTVKPKGSIWLKMPDGESHSIGVKIGTDEFSIEVNEFNESRWHMVTV
jgi:hypothetical protein